MTKRAILLISLLLVLSISTITKAQGVYQTTPGATQYTYPTGVVQQTYGNPYGGDPNTVGYQYPPQQGYPQYPQQYQQQVVQQQAYYQPSLFKPFLYQAAIIGVQTGAQWFLTRDAINRSSKVQVAGQIKIMHEQEKIDIERDKRTVSFQMWIMQQQQQSMQQQTIQQPAQQPMGRQQSPQGSAPEAVRWIEMKITNCYQSSIQLVFNQQVITFENGVTTIPHLYKVHFRVPQVSGGTLVAVRQDGSIIQEFNLNSGTTDLVVK